MKSLALLTATVALGLTLVSGDADAAKRFGGGKTSGMQRQEINQPHTSNATPATPAQAPGAAAAPARAQQAGAAATPQAQPKRSHFQGYIYSQSPALQPPPDFAPVRLTK